MKKWNESDFDRYLNKEMSSVENIDFEQALGTESSLMEQFGQYQKTIALIEGSFQRKSQKKRLHQLHWELFDESGRSKTARKRRTRIIEFSTQLAVAASVALMISSGVFYFWKEYILNHEEVYVELRNEVQGIYSEQESIKEELRKTQPMPLYHTGTSFAVSADGYMATNYHVIRGADSVWVTNYIDSIVRYKAIVVHKSIEHDIALLKISDEKFQGFGRLPYARPSVGAEMGEYVFTLGFSKLDVVFGEGSISSISGYNNDTTSYQVSIPVNPGNSGGPLFDNNGQLLGIISGKSNHKDGAGFAIKCQYIYEALEDIAQSNSEHQPQILMKNTISGKRRTEQLKTLQPFVFKVQMIR